ncbi:alpha/beta fold hydrolase [Nocardia sp. NPDC004568]|uniref:alpha/beta fold hydrolase n=1 Tax=Nocardia sp. NPDC004568 TaxID=3154551 RepID=UPI0033BE89E2
MSTPDTVVFGSAGFIGRALVARLLEQGHSVAAAVRPGTGARLLSWLDGRDLDLERLTVLDCDITDPGLGALGAAALDDVRDVYNCAARFSFGLDPAEARAVNIDGALHVLRWSADRPRLRRLVHITGYRVTVPDSAEHDYAVGAYGASKFEADAVLREQAAAAGVPLTIANPSSVLGPGQYIGLAELVRDLWHGTLPALPGDSQTLLPILDLDYFLDFLTLLPRQPDTAGRSYTVLDPATPPLPEMIGLLARHLHVRAPRLTLPVGLVARLPRRLTGVDAERLAFIAGDRYDTSAADAVAARAGLVQPAAETVLREWANHLVSSRFGATEADPAAGFDHGLWVSGDRHTPEYVLLHGLPTDSEAWHGIRTLLDAPTLAADLPGLGRSAPRPAGPDRWLDDLMAPIEGRPVLAGHSLGCVPVLRYATAHPDRVAGVVLVAPAFLQRGGSRLARTPIATALLRRLPSARLATLLGIPAGPALESARANLRRPRVARRTVAALRAAGRPGAHATARRLLDELRVPVHVVTGSGDPLTAQVTAPVTEIPGAGHYPHLTHPEQVARILDSVGKDFTDRARRREETAAGR